MKTPEELFDMWEQLKSSSGDSQRSIFFEYCNKIVTLKENGILSEEEAGYEIIRAIKFKDLSSSPLCEAVFGAAGVVEVPRVASYAQKIGEWDQKTADQIKAREWEALVALIRNWE